MRPHSNQAAVYSQHAPEHSLPATSSSHIIRNFSVQMYQVARTARNVADQSASSAAAKPIQPMWWHPCSFCHSSEVTAAVQSKGKPAEYAKEPKPCQQLALGMHLHAGCDPRLPAWGLPLGAEAPVMTLRDESAPRCTGRADSTGQGRQHRADRTGQTAQHSTA